MSNLERDPRETLSGGRTAVAAAPVRDLLPAHTVALGGTRAMTVSRTLPNRERRMVGAWCFADYYGPDKVAGGAGMQVPPHPHTGLQTVSWLFAGQVLHRDSLGSRQLARPGELNLMTAGRAIAHSEESPADHDPVLHGVQLWVALPDGDRQVDPQFEHHADLPVSSDGGVAVTVIMGELGEVRSPARTYSPLVGADVRLASGTDTRLPLRPDFEFAALAVDGAVEVDGVPLDPGPLLYLGTGRSDLAVRTEWGGRMMLLGGEPFDEQIVMWWNFVGRDHDEIVAMREEWMVGEAFGTVRGYDGDRLPAPAMPTTRLKARGRQR
ncbi:MAG: pirin family protein [Actinomycetota bacterium]|nr:pirin family protein [Actinomycetota bacterium]